MTSVNSSLELAVAAHGAFNPPEPDEVRRVRLKEGFEVQTYRYGPEPSSGVPVLLLVNGGPGLPCDYLRDAHAHLASSQLTVIAYDQLGCGASDRPNDSALWTIERYVEELVQICTALDLPKVDLLGHSWGTWLGTEFCLFHPQRTRSFICADGACDIPHLVEELNRLRAALGPETVAMMQRFEAERRFDHPSYQAAITLLTFRHVCRLDTWPAALNRSIADWNTAPYETMQGPNEFTFTGNMSNWNRIPQMDRILVPTLVLAGAHDELTPACSTKIHRAIPDSKIHIFANSSHMPFYEEPDTYFRILSDFLASTRNHVAG
jgi:proline iminopeptidase